MTKESTMNDDKNSTNENQPSSEEPTKEKIPLWLQGLEDEDRDETINLPEEEVNTEGSWVKEIEQEDDELVSGGDTLSRANKEVQLPDWIRENAEYQADEPVSNDLSRKGEEETQDKNDSLRAATNGTESDEELPANESTDHGFIDISELEMEDSREPVQFIPIEEEDVNEELPAWLHDMINDQPDQSVIHTEKKDMDMQLKNSEQEMAEGSQTDLETKEETWQEISTAEEQGLTENDQPFKGEQYSEITDEEITKPVQVEPGQPEEWVQVEEAFVFPEDKNIFERAEALLIQGNITDGIELLSQELEGSPSEDDLKKIQTMIDNFPEKSGKEKMTLLEFKGDLALKMNDPSGAFKAYSQALKTLLSQKEVKDGIG